MNPGRFITFEGGDGAGKSTSLQWVRELLESAGRDVVQTREPGGTALGETLRRIVLDPATVMDPEVELMLIFAARTQHVRELILPGLQQGKWILCDRFTDASYAYQGGGRQIEDARITALEQWALDGIQPDLTILLDVPVDVAEERLRGKSPDRFEGGDIAFKQRIRQSYLERCRQDPERIKWVDAALPMQQVHLEIRNIMKAFIANDSGAGS